MLYLFHVEPGNMMDFDMGVALESVHYLKQQVEKLIELPPNKQVLLISGGESLDPNKRVCSYSAGTDTSPIFLFSKDIIESTSPPQPTPDDSAEYDLSEKLKEYCDLPPTYATVVKRAQLAQEFLEMAQNLYKTCEKLVLEQHLQQQGWAAVVANLEDITADFKKRTKVFEKSFTGYLDERDEYLTFLKYFESDLKLLRQIPIVSSLLDEEDKDSAASTSQENEPSTSKSGSSSTKETSLFQWISSTDDKNSMDLLYEHCSRGLEQFDGKVFRRLRDDVLDMLSSANNPQMKEVKGLGDRLSGLETLMREAKKFVQEQTDLAQSFIKNQNRASNLKDSSILPDLCASHRKQLQVMAQIHKQLCDIKRRCVKAKDELSVNLYHRLKWVMYIEDRIVDIDQKLVIYHENLKRLRRHLEVLQQIHLAPATYLSAVAEVVRRRTFSQSFLLWASELACHMLTIHNDEVTRRKEFQAQFEGHFLNSLFPGIDDLPPAFATQAPSIFDSGLPKITQEDVDRLKEELPDLAENLNIPDSSAITNFFLLKSFMKTDMDKDDTKAVEDKLVQVVSEVGLASNLDRNLLNAASEPCLTTVHGLPHLKDLDRGCESETDTEEFEKVGQSPLELHFDKEIPSPRPGTQDASTLTEDNLQISRSEHEKLKSFLVQLAILAKQATVQLRSELTDLKTDIVTDKSILEKHYSNLGSCWNHLKDDRELKEKETIEAIKRDYEAVVEEMRLMQEEKIKQIKILEEDKAALESTVQMKIAEVAKLKEKIKTIEEEHLVALEELQKQLQNKDLEKDKQIKDAMDRLTQNHKAEIESIRSRFKLMTMDKMERSPSDNSLEKIGDFSSLPNHESILLQITENFELDKEKSISEVMAQQEAKWQKIMEERLAEMENKLQEEKNTLMFDVAKKITEEKDKQLDVLREREKNLSFECMKHKNTILQLTESVETQSTELLEKLDILQKQKEILEEKLEKIQSERTVDLAASVAIVEDKVDATTSPIKQKKTLAKSDSVVKPDFLSVLNLDIVDGKPNKNYCTGEVMDKEYCHARKSENRYKVAKGTKFFRVKVKPLASTSKEITQSMFCPKAAATMLGYMSQSQTAGTSTGELSDSVKPTHSLPSTPSKVIPESIEDENECENPSENPEEMRPSSVEKNFDRDSGIVDNIEQATAAGESLEDVVAEDRNRNESESSDR